jgi:aminoglycoside phosphotransferase (APT) family kinase protein
LQLDPRTGALLRHLGENARHYFPDLDAQSVRVELVGSRAGAASSLLRFRIRAGARDRLVVVKQPAPAPSPARGRRRARVAPALDPATSFESERAALRAIGEHFTSLGDPRFGSVGLLDFLPETRALVMEERDAPSLRDLLARSHRLRHPRGARALEAALRNTGAWLRAYHALPPLAHTRVRHAERGDFVASVRRLCGFVAERVAGAALLDGIAACVAAAARTALPPRLPLGTAHGDLAPRNVLVDESGRVTVLDTRAAWRAPVYEDLAYFLTALRTSRAQAYSLGLALGPTALARYEEAFLCGYFGAERVPLASIRLFEIEALLDRWAARASEGEVQVGAAAALRRWSLQRLLRREVASAAARVDATLAAR